MLEGQQAMNKQVPQAGFAPPTLLGCHSRPAGGLRAGGGLEGWRSASVERTMLTALGALKDLSIMMSGPAEETERGS